MFIGIASRGGFGVFDDSNRLENVKEHLYKPIMKSFDSFYEAFVFASDVYNEFQAEADYDKDTSFYGSVKDVKKNWLIFRKEIIKENEKDYI